MIRNIKVLGLAIVAVLALTAVAASAAQAAPEFHCTSTSASCFIVSSGGTHGTGSNDNVFNVSGGNVKCTGNTTVDGAQFSGTEVKTSTTATLAPVYTGCKAFGVAATVKPEGCTYRFHLTAGGTSPYPVTTDVVCPAGKSITVTPTGLSCTITVGAQLGLKGITLTNAGTEPTHIAANIAITGISYTKTGTECPEGAGSGNTGTYNGTATLTGYEDNAGVKGTKVGLHVF